MLSNADGPARELEHFGGPSPAMNDRSRAYFFASAAGDPAGVAYDFGVRSGGGSL
jgi:hypothetical protein